MNIVIPVVAGAIIDIIGYVVKMRTSKTFNNYHLRTMPFIWFFYSDALNP